MYNNPYFIPGYYPANIAPTLTRGIMTNTAPALARGMSANIAPSLARGIPQADILNNTARAGGLFQRLGTSLAGIRKLNWSGLINNTSKTLGIINQTIPVVRQVGPIFNNMKQMVRVASIFKDETDGKKVTNSTNQNNNNNQQPTYTNKQITTKQNNNQNPKTNPEQIYTSNKEDIDASPTFFLK